MLKTEVKNKLTFTALYAPTLASISHIVPDIIDMGYLDLKVKSTEYWGVKDTFTRKVSGLWLLDSTISFLVGNVETVPLQFTMKNWDLKKP